MTGPLGRRQQDQTTPSTAVMILPTAARALVADATNNSNPARRDDSPDCGPSGVTSSRITRASPTARAVHLAILRGFATTGQAPDRVALADAAPDGHDLDVLLAELHEQDVVRLDGASRVRAAYPFSAVPTPHLVAIDRVPWCTRCAPSTPSASPTCSAARSASPPPIPRRAGRSGWTSTTGAPIGCRRRRWCSSAPMPARALRPRHAARPVRRARSWPRTAAAV